MTHENLAVIWFGLWGLLWTVYFITDGYTLGTGMLFPFLAKGEGERKQMEGAVLPFWAGHEVWLITAGGVTFAAFPLTYALLFSTLYVPLMLILFALFFRSTGLEFRHLHLAPHWRETWKWAFFLGSAMVSLLFGVAFANLFRGLPLGPGGLAGGWLSLLNPYGLLGGVLFVGFFLLSGALWTVYKTAGPLQERAYGWVKALWPGALAVLALFFAASANGTELFAKAATYPALWLLPVTALAAQGLVRPVLGRGWALGAFALHSLSIAAFMATGFAGMFPYMLPSRLDPGHGVTLYQAASSPLTLTIMLGVTLAVIPVVIGYQLWMYRIFRDRIEAEEVR